MRDDDAGDLGKFTRSSDDDIRPIDTPQRARQDDAPPVNFVPKEPEHAAPKAEAKILADGTFISAEIAAHMFDNEQNILHKGDYLDLRKKIPTLKHLYIATGWEQRDIELVPVDVDLSCFLLDKNGQTREDHEFVFYNNPKAYDGAVAHLGDNRVGAAEGDNESIFIDFENIPFDIVKLDIVLSIYDENADGFHFGLTRDLFVRAVNQEDDMEIFRLTFTGEEVSGQTLVRAVTLVREGPKWFAEGTAEASKGSLGTIAKSYGIIVQEDTG